MFKPSTPTATGAALGMTAVEAIEGEPRQREEGGPAVPLAAVDMGEPGWWVESAVNEG